MRVSYWSCSKFADWVRGTKKPYAASMEDWGAWRKTAEDVSFIRYWIAEELLDNIQSFFCWPSDKIHSITYYCNNRWFTKSHQLTAHPRDIKPGDWRDVGNRFLPCLFNELVDFVEIEQAVHFLMCDENKRKEFGWPTSEFSFWTRRTWRSPAAGIAHLNWAKSLTHSEDWGMDPTHPEFGKPTGQAIAAAEILELYTWWTVTYRNRPDPYEASGWSEYCKTHKNMFSSGPKDETDKDTGEAARKLLDEIERQYTKEDEEMMIRLIKVRDGLWT